MLKQKILLLFAMPLFLVAVPASAAALGIPFGAKANPNCEIKNPSDTQLSTCLRGNPLVNDIKTVVNILSGMVGIAIVAGIIIGGAQYSLAGDTPEAVGRAKKRIMNSLIALLAFMFIFSFVQWLIPGGIFNTP